MNAYSTKSRMVLICGDLDMPGGTTIFILDHPMSGLDWGSVSDYYRHKERECVCGGGGGYVLLCLVIQV